MADEPKSMESRGLSEDEANEFMDRWLTEKFGKTYREPSPVVDTVQGDSLEQIIRDYRSLFGEGPSGTA